MKKFWLVAAGCILAACLLLSCTSKKNVEEQKHLAEKYRDLGEAYFKEGKYTAALKEFLKAERLNPDDYFIHNDLGLAYDFKKEHDLAIRHYKKALALKNDYAPARNNLGNAYMRKGEWDKAIEQYEIILSDLLYATPQFPLSNLGLAYYQKKEYGPSEKYYLKALDVKLDFVNAAYGLGRTYLAMGRVPEAISRLEDALKSAPKEAAIHFELAKAYTKNREYKKAYDAYQQVIQLNPGSSLADRAMLEAQKIRYLF
jgi:Tfp pilus assembly protein PilF